MSFLHLSTYMPGVHVHPRSVLDVGVREGAAIDERVLSDKALGEIGEFVR